MGQGLGCSLGLAWWVKEEKREASLDRGQYILGRLDKEDLKRYAHHKPSQARVYLYKPEEDVLQDTGIESLVVSRRHALLTPDPSRCTLRVRDHGPTGERSKNGTYVTNTRLMGGEAEAAPGDVIRLGSTGPQFLVLGYRGGKPFIVVKGGVPVGLPAGLARYLGAGSVGGGEAQLILEPGKYTAGGIEVIARETGPAERRRETLMRAQLITTRILRYTAERRLEEAYRDLMLLLEDQALAEALEGAGSHISGLYRELRTYIGQSASGVGIVLDDEVRRMLYRLEGYIEEHLVRGPG